MSAYVLALSDAEVARYQMMAQGAAEDEADRWAAAGIAAGAVVADVGCGLGAVSAPRYLSEQWCHDCSRPCQRLGAGGICPCCEEMITVQELPKRATRANPCPRPAHPSIVEEASTIRGEAHLARELVDDQRLPWNDPATPPNSPLHVSAEGFADSTQPLAHQPVRRNPTDPDPDAQETPDDHPEPVTPQSRKPHDTLTWV